MAIDEIHHAPHEVTTELALPQVIGSDAAIAFDRYAEVAESLGETGTERVQTVRPETL